MDLVNTMDDQPVTAADVDFQARFFNFKQTLADIRSVQINATSEINAISEQLKNLGYSRSTLIDQFTTEALAMYPDLDPTQLESTMQTLASGHPLLQLWEQYAAKLTEIDQSTQSLYGEAEVQKSVLDQATADENQTLSIYDQFRAGAPDFLPPVEVLKAQVEAESAIPQAEESSMVASLPMIDQVSPEAAAIVMLQSADTEGSDSNTDPDDSHDGEYTGQGEIYTMMNKSSDMIPDSSLTASLMQPSNLKPIGIAIGCLVLAYVLFGGGNEKS